MAGADPAVTNNPPAGDSGSFTDHGPTLSCSDPSSITGLGYNISEFPLCTFDQNPPVTITAVGETPCANGFDVWRFYSMSNAPTVALETTESYAPQDSELCGATTTGQFASPSPADTSAGTAPSANLSSPNGKQFPALTSSSSPTGATVYVAPGTSSVTSNATFSQTGESCANLENLGSASYAKSIFSDVAAGTGATDTTTFADETTFADAYWKDYEKEATYYPSTPNLDLVMDLSAATPRLASSSSPTAHDLTVIAGGYGVGVPACSSAYQFAPTWTVGTPKPATVLIGACAMPVVQVAYVWSGGAQTNITAFLNNTDGRGPRYYVNGGINNNTGAPLSSGTDTYSSGLNSVEYGDLTSAFSAWRSDISSDVKKLGTSKATNYVGSSFVSGAGGSIVNQTAYMAPYETSSDISIAANEASTDAACAGSTSAVPVVPVVGTTTTTTTLKKGTTTTTLKKGTTTTTTTTTLPSLPIQSVTPNAATLTAGGSLSPNTVSMTISPWACPGANCNPFGAGNDIWESLTVTPEISVSGNYSDFWINGDPSYTPTCSNGTCTLVLPPINLTSSGNFTYSCGGATTTASPASGGKFSCNIDFAYATTPAQKVTYGYITPVTGVYLEWKRVQDGQTCTTKTTGTGKNKKSTTTCVPVYVNLPFATSYSPTLDPQIVTKVIGGAVSPS
jgi:hypothetical protein